jgi:hypothetical protein
MKIKEFEALKTDDVILHKYFGVCIVNRRIGQLGISITPMTTDGINILFQWSRTTILDTLEGSYRLCNKYPDEIPPELFKRLKNQLKKLRIKYHKPSKQPKHKPL